MLKSQITQVFLRLMLSLRLTKHNATKTYEGAEVWFHSFLTPAPDTAKGHFHARAALSFAK